MTDPHSDDPMFLGMIANARKKQKPGQATGVKQRPSEAILPLLHGFFKKLNKSQSVINDVDGFTEMLTKNLDEFLLKYESSTLPHD